EGAGRIAVSADGSRVIWQPRDGVHWLTDNHGARWQKVAGLPATARVAADRFDPGLWYGFDPASGALHVSGDGGVSFAAARGGVGEVGGWFGGEPVPSTRQTGVVYVAASWRGLLRWSTRGLQRLAGVDNAFSVGLGAPAPGREVPALYLHGEVDGQVGLYRSDDEGRSWLRIDDPRHRFGSVRMLTGDARIHGRVYLATGGRGVIYGEPGP